MELTPVKLYLMYVVPIGTLMFLTWMLYPEIVVHNRFEPAVCKVTSKITRNEARIVTVVTVFDGEGNPVDVFGADACNPMDCVRKEGEFMDKKEWLDMYEEDKEYPCLYDPLRDQGGEHWVVFVPVRQKVYTWIFFLATCSILFGVMVLHLYLKYINGDFSGPVLKEKCGSCVGCVSCCAGWCQDRGSAVSSWWRRRRGGYTMQADFELEECEVYTEPPSYDSSREPPPSYNVVVVPEETESAPEPHVAQIPSHARIFLRY